MIRLLRRVLCWVDRHHWQDQHVLWPEPRQWRCDWCGESMMSTISAEQWAALKAKRGDAD